MQRKSKLPIILLIGVLLIVIDLWYFKTNKKEDEPLELEKNPTGEVEPLEKYYNCEQGFICEKIDGVEYKWTNKTKLNIANTYNYESDELEAGTLEINNSGELVFLDLSGSTLETYESIDGKVISMAESIDLCDEKPLYIVLTDKGKLYRNDAQSGLLIIDAFYQIESEEVFTHFYTKVNSTDYACTVTEIYAKNEDEEIIKLLSNENVTVE